MLLKTHIDAAVKKTVTDVAPAGALDEVTKPLVRAEIEKQAKRIRDVIDWESKFEGEMGKTYPRGTGFVGADGKEEKRQTVTQVKLLEKLTPLKARYETAVRQAYPELNEDEAQQKNPPNFGEIDKLLKEPLPTLKERDDAPAAAAPAK